MVNGHHSNVTGSGNFQKVIFGFDKFDLEKIFNTSD